MRSWNLLLHVCTGVTLVLASLFLLNDVYGDLPTCDGTQPDTAYSCGEAADCPSFGVDEAECEDPDTTCVVQQYVAGVCIGGGNILQDLCVEEIVACTNYYYCEWIETYGCYCGSEQVKDENGNPVGSTTSAGYLVACSPGGG